MYNGMWSPIRHPLPHAIVFIGSLLTCLSMVHILLDKTSEKHTEYTSCNKINSFCHYMFHALDRHTNIYTHTLIHMLEEKKI